MLSVRLLGDFDLRLGDSPVPPLESARAEFNEATARKITDQKSFDDRQRRLQRGRVMQAFAARR